MSSLRARPPALPAHVAVPAGAALLLVVGALAAELSGRLSGDTVAVMCAAVVVVVASVTDPRAAVALGVIAWMTASSFAKPPYGSLHAGGHQAAVGAAWVAAGLMCGVAVRLVGVLTSATEDARTLEVVTGLAAFTAAIGRRRQMLGWLLAAVLLPALTAILTSLRAQLSLTDNLLIYLLVVVSVAVVGGFWPAVSAAVAASLLVNWFFTAPFHTLTIAKPDNLLALLLFVVVAVAVSSVVHLAARRLVLAQRSRAEAEALARLAQSVLGDEDTPLAVLRHLQGARIGGAELLEQVGGRWVRVAQSGDTSLGERHRIMARDNLALVVFGCATGENRRVLEAAAGQAAAALDRDRLRTQAAQAEALAAGNRMRTALLAAVSHDLRTPLASIKAGITSLRQSDVHWSPEDEAALLETIEESTDRLDGLIANLLDMSRVQTGALQPFLRDAAVDEIVPLALRGLPAAAKVDLDVPEAMPLVRTDAGLLERALANLVANAARFSPPGRPVRIEATAADGVVRIAVVDHGPGVDATDRERIFEPFQRLGDQDATTGVGLGLAVARGFIESVGGAVVPSDTPGGGLTMTVTLPAARTSTQSARPQVEP